MKTYVIQLILLLSIFKLGDSSPNELDSTDEKTGVPNGPPNNQPSAPSAPSDGSLYPKLHLEQTTPRSSAYKPGQSQSSRGGYQGGVVGSGYPGQQPSQGRYPSQGGGYYPQSGGNSPRGGYPQYAQPPSQSGYPTQGSYPQGGYPQGGYPQNGGGGQRGGYPQYSGGYPQQGGYYPQGGSYPGYPNQSPQGRYPNGNQNQRNNGESTFLDGVWKGLKNIGATLLKPPGQG